MTKELKELENKLWDAAVKMRSGISVSNYKFVILGLIFLKYISDAFEERHDELVEEGMGFEKLKDAYTEVNVFFVPEKSRWSYISSKSKDPNIGEIVDNALDLIEKENTTLKGVLFKVYNQPDMRNLHLGEIIDLFDNVNVGTKDARDKDILGRIYEYFLSQFAATELVKGGEFYTPDSLVKLMVEMIEPYKGRVYDPAAGSGGMFVQSLKFIENHQGNIREVSIYGQEIEPTTWKLAKMNLAIRGIDADLGKFPSNTFLDDLHKDLKADFILANPPFNQEDWGREKLLDDPRWKYGIPPKGNANYAWIQHMISKLSNKGKAAIILANGSLSSNQKAEFEIRKQLIDEGLVDAIVAMPTNLFYTVTVPCSIWFLNKNKKDKESVLFINATNLGKMINQRNRVLEEDDILKISSAYKNYKNNNNYEDVVEFSKQVSVDEIRESDYSLIPGRYVGIKKEREDTISFEEKMESLTSQLKHQLNKSEKMNKELKEILEAIGYVI